MSHITTAIRPCPEWKGFIQDVWIRCQDPQLIAMPQEVALATYLMSPENRGNLQARSVPMAGKHREVEVLYTPRVLMNEIAGTVSASCPSDAPTPGTKYKKYNVDETKGCEYSEAVDLRQLTENCESNMEYLARLLLRMLNGMDRKVETLLWNDMTTIPGAFAASDTNNVTGSVKTVSPYRSDGTLNRRFMSELKFSAMAAAYCGAPAYFGWGDTLMAFEEHRLGCCAQDGSDIGRAFREHRMAFFGSENAETAFGNDFFISLDTGAVQLISWNMYSNSPDGDLHHADEAFHKRSTITSPLTGITYDMLWERVCDKPVITLKFTGEVHGMPIDMFDDTDGLEGVNFANIFKVSTTGA